MAAAFAESARSLSQLDPPSRASLAQREAKLGRQIDFVLANPGESEQDLKESAARQRELRARREGVRAELAALETAAAEGPVPTEADIAAGLADLPSDGAKAAPGEAAPDRVDTESQ